MLIASNSITAEPTPSDFELMLIRLFPFSVLQVLLYLRSWLSSQGALISNLETGSFNMWVSISTFQVVRRALNAIDSPVERKAQLQAKKKNAVQC